MTKTQEFPHPYVTVDILIFAVINNELNTLLIRRHHDPFAGMFAVPGGFVRVDESLDDAAERVLEEKGRVHNVYLEQLYTFGDVGRDPRGRVVSVSYFSLVPRDKVKEIKDPEHEVVWFPVKKLPPLAFDHRKIIATALDRIKNKIGYSTLASGLLPAKFRLTELQKVYEAILDQQIDKRNFRKKMTTLKLVEPVGERVIEGKHRPAMLYRFRTRDLVIFD